MSNSKELALLLVNKDPESLRNFSDELRNNRDGVLDAVRKYRPVLRWASEELPNDREIV